jgi:hypothetical protein
LLPRYDSSRQIPAAKRFSPAIRPYNSSQPHVLQAAQETMEQLLSVLYGVSGIAASALYIPQILKYHRDRASRESISLLSWGGWILIATITIAYALLVVKSTLIAAVAGLNIVAQITVLAYGVSARLRITSMHQRTAARH